MVFHNENGAVLSVSPIFGISAYVEVQIYRTAYTKNRYIKTNGDDQALTDIVNIILSNAKKDAESKAMRAAGKSELENIGHLPFSAERLSDGTFAVSYKKTMTLEQVKKLAEFLEGL
jgi:hypothetical protein